MTIRVEIDASDVLDELSDDELLREIELRKLNSKRTENVNHDLEEDATRLRRAIQHSDWLEAMIYLDRIFPLEKRNTTQIAVMYQAWKDGKIKEV